MILYIVCTNVLHKWIFTTIIIIIFVVSYMYFVANYIVPTGTIEAPKWHSYSFRILLIVLDHQQLSDWHKQNSAFSWIVNCWKINLQRNQRDHDKLDSEGCAASSPFFSPLASGPKGTSFSFLIGLVPPFLDHSYARQSITYDIYDYKYVSTCGKRLPDLWSTTDEVKHLSRIQQLLELPQHLYSLYHHHHYHHHHHQRQWCN